MSGGFPSIVPDEWGYTWHMCLMSGGFPAGIYGDEWTEMYLAYGRIRISTDQWRLLSPPVLPFLYAAG